MEHTKVEVEAVETVVSQVEEQQVRPLNDLQLALIGGGIGDVTWS
jgi:hypothetical protein